MAEVYRMSDGNLKLPLVWRVFSDIIVCCDGQLLETFPTRVQYIRCRLASVQKIPDINSEALFNQQHSLIFRLMMDTELDFRQLPLIGREEEIGAIEEAYQQSDNVCKVVWVSGSAGVGKSVLVENALAAKKYFCSGKFDKLRSPEPFSALADALSTLCSMLKSDGAKIQLTPEDASVLCKIIPATAHVLGYNGTKHASVGYKTEWGLERLKQAIRSFIKATCNLLTSPLVLVLDDMQWADVDSLGIIMSLLKESTVEGLLFVGTYRNEEVGSRDLLAGAINGLPEVKHPCDIESIELASLDRDATYHLITAVTKMPLSKARGLGNLLFPKTSGNCFFLVRMLHHIHSKKLLRFSVCTCCWEWDEERIRLEIDASENVVGFLRKQMRALPTTTMEALELAACLGTRVDIELLEVIVSKFSTFSSLPSLTDILGVAEAADLIVVNSDFTRMKFTHDRVAAAAYDLIPSGHARQSLHLQIGRHLLSYNLDSRRDNQWRLVLAVDQMNRGRQLLENYTERVQLANLNSNAAQHLIATSAFKMANTFLNVGIELLGIRRWETQYELTLHLSNSLGSVLFSNGLMEECLCIVEEIYIKSRCEGDKYKAQSIHVEALACTNRLTECMAASFKILRGLRHPRLPRRPSLIHVIHGMMGVEKLLRNLTDEQLLGLPECTDLTKLAAMRQLGSLGPVAFFANQELLCPILTCRMMQISLRSGLSEYSAYALASFAFSQTVTGNFEQAFRYANLALKIMKRFGEDARTLTMVYGLLYHVKKPIADSKSHTLRAFHVAFSQGDLSFAGQACTLHIYARIVAGLSLENIAKDQHHFFNQIVAYNQTWMCNVLLSTHRPVLELMDRSDEIAEMTKLSTFRGGELLLSDEEFEDYLNQNGAEMALLGFWIFVMWTRIILGNNASALAFGEKCWKSKGLSGALPYAGTYFLFSSLTALEAWKMTKKRRYWRIFRRFHAELKKFVKGGNPNSVHMVTLLDAEVLVVQKAKSDEVKRTYEKAIAIARRGGFVQDAALANERIGAYFLEQHDNDWACHYLRMAMELFNEWGAEAKVRQMTKRHGLLLAAGQSKSFRRSRRSKLKNSVFVGRSTHFEIGLVEEERNEPLLSMDTSSDDGQTLDSF